MQVDVGSILAVRSIGDDEDPFWICKLLSKEGETCHVKFFGVANKTWKEMADAEVGAFGEVEMGSILSRGALLTTKGKLKEHVLKEIEKQIDAEKEDRMVTD